MAACSNQRESSDVSRRSFLKGSAAVAGASLALAGGIPQTVIAEEADFDPTIGADPIPPREVPDIWDAEADAVIVGTGGGGLAASLYLAQQGLSVIALEKEPMVGGATRHAEALINVFGGAKEQNEMEYGWPTWPLDLDAFTYEYCKQHHWTVDTELVRSFTGMGGEAFDWMLSQDGVRMTCIGIGYIADDVLMGKQSHVMGMDSVVRAFEENVAKAGVDLRLQSPCVALVHDGEMVAGVVAKPSDGNEVFIKANKGVILCAGGIGMNKDLIAKYLPSFVKGAVQGGPMPYHTGEAFRMGLGVGADFSGFDSCSCWEAGIDESLCGGDGGFWHYFYAGERQMFHCPTLIIDKQGHRLPYYSIEVQPGFDINPASEHGDLATCNTWMSAIGGHAYSFFDSNFPEYVYKCERQIVGGDTGRLYPIDESQKELLPESVGSLVSTDWIGEVNKAVERGAVKKADTIEELAGMLRLDPAILQSAVDNWNRICAQGVDDEMPIPYDESWLNPVAVPPYYAAIVGGQIGKTLCGLRVDPQLRVIDPEAKAIKGLYANYTTAGGIDGEHGHGLWNPSMFAGNALSWVSGYVAAKTLLND